MIKTIGIGMFAAVVGMGLGIRAVAVHADDKVDCSKVSKFDDHKKYAKGDLVWYSSGGSAMQYRCKAIQCTQIPGMSEWEKLSECRIGSYK